MSDQRQTREKVSSRGPADLAPQSASPGRRRAGQRAEGQTSSPGSFLPSEVEGVTTTTGTMEITESAKWCSVSPVTGARYLCFDETKADNLAPDFSTCFRNGRGPGRGPAEDGWASGIDWYPA